MTARRPADLFELLALQAAGCAIPEPPAMPGRRIVRQVSFPNNADPFAEAWDLGPAAVAEWASAKVEERRGLQRDLAACPPNCPPPAASAAAHTPSRITAGTPVTLDRPQACHQSPSLPL